MTAVYVLPYHPLPLRSQTLIQEPQIWPSETVYPNFGDNRAKHFFFSSSSWMHPALFPLREGDKLPSPSIKHPSSCSNWDPWTTAWAVSHLLPCWYHSNDSLAKINQIFWKALYPLPRCVTDVRQTWLHLSPWRMVGCWTWMDASVPAETAQIITDQPWLVQWEWGAKVHALK